MPAWRRTLYIIWFTQFVAIVGFYFVAPFIPYYIEDLGVSGTGRVALWSGLCTSATALGLAIMAPVWGALADRHGRKLMILRATFAGVLVMTMMGLVVSVQQLLALRFLQGILTGTITASTTLVAGIAPDEHRGSALGSLQTAIFLGTTLGPPFGGLAGDAFGYRQSFWITGGLLLVSGLVVLFFVHEDFQPAAGAAVGRVYRHALPYVLAAGGAVLAILTARTILRAGSMVTAPVLALFVRQLLPGSAHSALVTGLVSGASAVGGAAGAPIIGGWGDRWGHRRLLIASGAAAALLYLPQAFVPGAASLVFWQLVSGFAVGGTLACGMALLAGATVRWREGLVFGLDGSALGLANAAGPLLGAAVAATLGLRAPFILASLILGAGTLVVVFWVNAKRWLAVPASS